MVRSLTYFIEWWSAPRLALMRCVTEVGSSHVEQVLLLLKFPSHLRTQQNVIEETSVSVLQAKRPIVKKDSSPNIRSSAKHVSSQHKVQTREGAHPIRGAMRQVEVPEEWSKNKSAIAVMAYMGIRCLGQCLQSCPLVCVLVVHIKCIILKTYLGASCYERNTYIKVSAYYEVQASKM